MCLAENIDYKIIALPGKLELSLKDAGRMQGRKMEPKMS